MDWRFAVQQLANVRKRLDRRNRVEPMSRDYLCSKSWNLTRRYNRSARHARKMDTEARKKEKEMEGKLWEMDQSYDGLDRSIGTIGLTDRIPTRPYECPTPAWQREKK